MTQDGEASEFFQELGPVWTEAVLSADLSSKERKAWAKKLESWRKEIDDYGVDEAFDAAHEAALQGWDDPQLQRVLQGTHSEDDSWDGEVAELTVARLHILERRGRLQEYLHLARAEGQHESYVTMLVHLGRTQERLTMGENIWRQHRKLLLWPWHCLTGENVSKACKSLRAVSCSRIKNISREVATR